MATTRKSTVASGKSTQSDDAAAAADRGDAGFDNLGFKKRALRKEVRAKLRAMSQPEIVAQSESVWQRLFTMKEYQQASNIGLFLSMPSGEIDTSLALKHAVANQKRVFVPRVGEKFEHADMDLIRVIDDGNSAADKDIDDDRLFYEKWPRNKWGIPEPPQDMPLQAAQPGDLDLIVLPGLAFDAAGRRLGQGKGYYDRFLGRILQTDRRPLLVAVGLTCQWVETPCSIPVEETDIPADMVLLPSEAVVCSSEKS